MYKFIETSHKELAISSSDIAELEKRYTIKIPAGLKEFYLKYNAAEISLCGFRSKIPPNEMFEVHIIYPIRYTPYKNGVLLEDVLYSDRMDGFIPSNLIPFAEDRGGNRYYCDENTETVYFISSDDIDSPQFVCENPAVFLSELENF